jgi:hypothetical protein
MDILREAKAMAESEVERDRNAEWRADAAAFLAERGLAAEFAAWRMDRLVSTLALQHNPVTPAGAAVCADDADELSYRWLRDDRECEYVGTVALEWANSLVEHPAEPFTTGFGRTGAVTFTPAGPVETEAAGHGVYAHRCTYRYAGWTEAP